MKIKNRYLFLLSTAVMAAYVAASYWFDHSRATKDIQAKPLAAGVWLAGQLHPESAGHLRDLGMVTVIDLRPDGEAADEPTSAAMEQALSKQGIQFSYVPAPRGDIPDEVADRLAVQLTEHRGDMLLYCRIGRRAARAWSLAEASRPEGKDLPSILAAVKSVGFTADDLQDRLRDRIAHRSSTMGGGHG